MRNIVLAVVMLAGSVSGAAAQSVFVDGTAFVGVERRSTIREATTASIDLNGLVGGGGVTVGTWISPAVSVRLQMMFPTRLEDSSEITEIPLVASTLPLGPFVTQRQETSERLSTVSALVGYHTPRRHGIQLAYLGGAAFVIAERTAHYTSIINYPTDLLAFGLLPREQSTEFSTTGYTVTAEVGLDADIAFASHFSVVPQVRLIGFGGGLSIRPGVSLRARW